MSPNIFKRSHFLIFTRNTPDRPCPSAHFHLSHVREKQCVCSYYNYLMCMYIIAQSCLTLCDPTDCSPPGSSVQGILQARILEWVAMPSSRGYFPLKDQTHVSCISCIGRLYHCATWGSPLIYYYVSVKKKKIEMITEKN